MHPARLILALTSVAFTVSGSGCMTAYKRSIGANAEQIASKSFRTSFSDAWQATLDALKSVRLDVSNRDAGFLQTRWMDNTAQKNLSDGDGMSVPYMRAKYRFKVNVAQTILGGQPVVKITVQRSQLVQKDALEDFRHQESDLIEEKTLLYRIGRIIAVKARLARDEKRRIEEEMKTFDPTASGSTPGSVPEATPPTSSGEGEASPPPNDGAAVTPGAEESPPEPEPEL